jgi:hypothetical protein
VNTTQPYTPQETHKTKQVPELLQQEASPETTTPKEEEWTLKEKIVYTLLAVVGLGGSVWLGRKLVKEAVSNKEEKKSFEDGTPATRAKQLKMAFENDGWWGTNTAALRETLTSVESQADWNLIVKSYQKLYNSNLLKDLADELQTTEYNEMLQIIGAKPLKRGQAPSITQHRAWAKRFKAAFDKEYGFLPGTDSEAMKVTLNEIPTQNDFIRMAVEYKKMYGTNFLDDLKSESEFGQYSDWMRLISGKRKT